MMIDFICTFARKLLLICGPVVILMILKCFNKKVLSYEFWEIYSILSLNIGQLYELWISIGKLGELCLSVGELYELYESA